MRGFVPWYTQKADALQRKKKSGSHRPTKIRPGKYFHEKLSWKTQPAKNLNHTVNSKKKITGHFLIHFSSEKTFYIDIDAFKRRGFETMVYHFKTTCNPEKPKRSEIEPIFFQPGVQRGKNEILAN